MNKNLEDTIKYILKDDRIDKEAKKFAIELMYEYHRDELDSELREYLCEQYAGAILELGSAAIPVGGLGKAGAVVGEQSLKKYLGRKISKEIGAGAVSGAVSGAVFGVGRGKMEGENPVVTAAQDALAGGIAGGALGAAAGNIEKAVRGNRLSLYSDEKIFSNNYKNYRKEAEEFYKDYIQGRAIKHKELGQILFTRKGMEEIFAKNPELGRLFPNLLKDIISSNDVSISELYKRRDKTGKEINIFYNLVNDKYKHYIAEDNLGNKKFYLTKNNITDQGTPSRVEGTSSGDIMNTNPAFLYDDQVHKSASDNIITNNSENVNSTVNNLNNNSYIQLSPTMLASGISKSENHIFTREEIAAMSRQEFEANEQAIMEQMRNGQIHSAPKDYSGFINPQSGDDRIFTREDLRNMKRNEYDENEAAIMAQLNTIGIPTNGELAAAEARNGVVYVRPYTRDDGTEVRGYYRSLPRR